MTPLNVEGNDALEFLALDILDLEKLCLMQPEEPSRYHNLPIPQTGDPSVVTVEDDELTLVDTCYVKV